jgi:nucleoid-associated protein YgaU
VSGEETEAAREDLWLTYQNYDPAVKQAVRRLGALPGNNVEEFRSLFLASRERKRVKEFEDDVVRRLQGEVFVGDEVLQQTLIVLHAENPGLAEQFKQFVTANGRPQDIDLTVARLRSGTDDPVMPERMPRKPREAAPSFIAPEPAAKTQAPEIPAPVAAKAPPPPAAKISQPAPPKPEAPPAPQPVFANDAAAPEETAQGSWIKRVAAIAAVLLIGGAGVWMLMPKSTTSEKPAGFETTTVPLRQVAEGTAEEKAPAPEPVKAAPAAEPAPSAPAQSAPVQPAPLQTAPSAPAAESLQAAPAQAQTRIGVQPPTQETAAPSANRAGNRPVPGSQYRVAKGDMLSVIALQAYGDASRYLLILRANPGLRNADRIYYDQTISLPPKP